MKYDAFAQLFREKAVGQNDSTAVPTATITLYANLAKDQIAREIVANATNGADYFNLTLLANLVQDQREYPFPDDVLKNIKMAEVYLDSKWRRMYPFDLNSYKLSGVENKPYEGRNISESFTGATTDETTISEQFTNENPQFDIEGRSIVIYSESVDVKEEGLKLRATIMPKDYVDADWTTSVQMSTRQGTTETVMPIQSHDIVLMKAVIEYKQTKGIPLTSFENTYFDELRKMIATLSEINDDEVYIATVPDDLTQY